MSEYKEEDITEVIPDWHTELAHDVMMEWNNGRQYVQDFDQLYEDIYRMMRGERPEKNYDWQSNIVINKVFQVVWTAIPYIVQKVFNADPIIGVNSFDKDGAWQRETLVQFWNTMQPGNSKSHTPFFSVLVIWTLRALLNGVGIVKKGWNQKLKTTTSELEAHIPVGVDEFGNPIMELVKSAKRTQVPVEDWPVTIPVNNKDIVFDSNVQPGQSIRQGRFIIHRMVKDLNSLYDSKIKYINLDMIDTGNSSTPTDEQDHGNLRGMDGQQTRPPSDFYTDIEIFERQGVLLVYKSGDKKGEACLDKNMIGADEVVEKEMIVTVAKTKKNETVIRFEPNPAGEMTYIDMHIFYDAEKFYSTGIIEPIMDTQTALNDNLNAGFDIMWQNLFAPAIFNKFALWDWDTVIHAPHQRWMVGGNPAESVMFKPSSNIPTDVWQKHQLLDNEIQLGSAATNNFAGGGREKAATTNVLNVQMSAGRFDFIVKMIEVTALVPSAQMDIRLAKKFASPFTFQAILGKPFVFTEEDIYRFIPAASSVKLEHQKNNEVQSDLQLIQAFSSFSNPNTPKIINEIYKNILRNRNMPKEAALLDESFFEPSSDAGNMQMLQRLTGGGPSNQNALPMSGQEADVRQNTYKPKGVAGA